MHQRLRVRKPRRKQAARMRWTWISWLEEWSCEKTGQTKRSSRERENEFLGVAESMAYLEFGKEKIDAFDNVDDIWSLVHKRMAEGRTDRPGVEVVLYDTHQECAFASYGQIDFRINHPTPLQKLVWICNHGGDFKPLWGELSLCWQLRMTAGR